MNVAMISSYSSFDVCTSSGVLLEIFSSIQQEGRTIRFNLEQQGYRVLPFTPPNGPIGATLFAGVEKLVVVDIDEGPLYYHHTTDGWFTAEESK